MSDLLYHAVCYLPYAVLLFFFMLIVPALAFFPSLLHKPFTATCIPIVSIFLVNVIAVILIKLGHYQTDTMRLVILFLTMLALYRSYQYWRRHTFEWQQTDFYILLLNISMLLPLIAFSGLSAFMSNDALASWNYWALHIYNSDFPDMMGYPPFYPIFLSACYHVLGTIEYQGVVKSILIVFPLTMLNAFAFSSQTTKKAPWLYLCIAGMCIFPGFLNLRFYRFYAVGYADPMLAAATVTALMQLLRYFENTEAKLYYCSAIMCTITAALTKQPGLWWAGVCVPILIAYRTYRTQKINWQEWLGVGLIFAFLLGWLLNAGAHFYHNPGVMRASLQQSQVTHLALLAAFGRSFLHYFILQPTFLALFIVAGIVSFHFIYQRIIYFIFIIPTTILWFVFGAYDLRLGLYILVSTGLLLLWNDHLIKMNLTNRLLKLTSRLSAITLKRWSHIFFMLGIMAFIIFSVTDQLNRHINKPGRVYPLQAGRSNIYHYFGEQAEYVYTQLFDKANIKIMTSDRLIAGIFYGHTPITILPNYDDAQALYRTILRDKPNYIIAVFCDRASAFCDQMHMLQHQHPELLSQIPLTDAEYAIQLYRVQ